MTQSTREHYLSIVINCFLFLWNVTINSNYIFNVFKKILLNKNIILLLKTHKIYAEDCGKPA